MYDANLTRQDVENWIGETNDDTIDELIATICLLCNGHLDAAKFTKQCQKLRTGDE
jgi:hypothetical protein